MMEVKASSIVLKSAAVALAAALFISLGGGSAVLLLSSLWGGRNVALSEVSDFHLPSLMMGEADPSLLVLGKPLPQPERRHYDMYANPDWELIFDEASPLVFRKPRMTKDWPATKWTPEYVSEKWADDPLLVHTSPTSTVQMMSMVQPFGSVPILNFTRQWEEESMSMENFLTNSPLSDRHLYVYKNLHDLPQSLLSDFGNIDLLGSAFRPMSEMAFWAGHPGISSPTHFDVANNVYVQLVGQKRFVLFPPNVSDALSVYPRLHPSTRQSQIDLRRVPKHLFSCFQELLTNGTSGAVEVVLNPGDVLYIPPLYWHMASVPAFSNTVSMSAAFYSPSTLMDAYDLIKSHPIPNNDEWTHDQKVAILLEYIYSLATLPLPGEKRPKEEDVDDEASAIATLRCLLEARYSPLEESSEIAIANGWKEMILLSRREFRWITWFRGRDTTPTQLKQNVRQHADSLAYAVSSAWERGAPISEEIWDMEIKSLIEDVICAVFGPRRVEPFLRMAVGDLKLWSMSNPI